MKKTIIAAAIATVIAAPAAMADVSVSGNVEQTYVDTDSDANGVDSSPDNSITFKASEDLGNGMTAFAQITLDTDNGSASKDEKVGVKGGFGTVVLGRMEDFSEGVMAATMTFNGPAGIELAGATGRNNGAVAYVSPTINGVHAGIAGYTGTGAVDTDTFDAVDMIIAYDNGPLSAKISHEILNGSVVSPAVTAVAAVGDTDTAQGTSEVTAIPEGSDQETTSISVKYAMGDLSAAVLHVSQDNAGGVAGADADDLMLRLDYKMGNNKITLGHAQNETSGAADVDVTALELTHSMSKRTSVYVGMSDSDTDTADNTYVGMIHKF
jgi:predicted porin